MYLNSYKNKVQYLQKKPSKKYKIRTKIEKGEGGEIEIYQIKNKVENINDILRNIKLYTFLFKLQYLYSRLHLHKVKLAVTKVAKI